MRPITDAHVTVGYGGHDNAANKKSDGIMYLCDKSRTVYWHLRRGTVVDVGHNEKHGTYVVVQRFARRHYLCHLGEASVVIGSAIKRGTMIGQANEPEHPYNYPHAYYEVRRYPYGPTKSVRPWKYVRETKR